MTQIAETSPLGGGVNSEKTQFATKSWAERMQSSYLHAAASIFVAEKVYTSALSICRNYFHELLLFWRCGVRLVVRLSAQLPPTSF